MINNHRWRTAVGGALVVGGSLAMATGAGAVTTGAPGSTFTQQQQQLEQQLAGRTTQLQHLVSDVQGATTLSPVNANILNARLSTEQASITALATKVPTDSTFAQLRADRQAMLRDNRVYAVMTPQVFVTIEASAAGAEATTLTANEPVLASEVASLLGMPGYQNAVNHYNNYVMRLAHVTTRMSDVVTRVLAQTPQGFPHNTHVFVTANRQVRDANVSMAYANYDASVIALATGGYTGS